MVIDKTFYLCPYSPCCSVGAFALPFFYQGYRRVQESYWMEKIFPLVGRGECVAPAMSVMGFLGAAPPLHYGRSVL